MVITWAHRVHPRLTILALLRCTKSFASHFGIKCSSFSKVNVGTSRRSACDALGFSEYLSVQQGNILLERTVPATTMIHDLFKMIDILTNQGFFKSRWCLDMFWNQTQVNFRLESLMYIWNLLSSHDACSIHSNNSSYQSQVDSRPLRARTCLLVLLVTALDGVWTLEQPSGSLLEFYPAWREVMCNIFRCGGEYAAMYLDQWCNAIIFFYSI